MKFGGLGPGIVWSEIMNDEGVNVMENSVIV